MPSESGIYTAFASLSMLCADFKNQHLRRLGHIEITTKILENAVGPFVVTRLDSDSGAYSTSIQVTKLALLEMLRTDGTYITIKITGDDALSVVKKSITQTMIDHLEIEQAIRGNGIHLIVTSKPVGRYYHATPHVHDDMSNRGSTLFLLGGCKAFAVQNLQTVTTTPAELINTEYATTVTMTSRSAFYFRPERRHEIFTFTDSVAISLKTMNMFYLPL
jgi:hypothetical protein